MLIVAYDISNTKARTKFAKFLSKFGYRLQYSVFELKNSARILSLVQAEIETGFSKRFGESDSVIVFQLSKQCKVTKYGYAKNDDEDLLVL